MRTRSLGPMSPPEAEAYVDMLLVMYSKYLSTYSGYLLDRTPADLKDATVAIVLAGDRAEAHRFLYTKLKDAYGEQLPDLP